MRIALSSFSSAAWLALLLQAAPVQALDLKTFVASFGSDMNPCTRAAPCRNFGQAISQAADGGEVNCLDSGPFGPILIGKSITLDCAGTSASVVANNPNDLAAVDFAEVAFSKT